MKKLLTVALATAVLAACNNEANNNDGADTTTVVNTDTTTVIAPAPVTYTDAIAKARGRAPSRRSPAGERGVMQA